MIHSLTGLDSWSFEGTYKDHSEVTGNWHKFDNESTRTCSNIHACLVDLTKQCICNIYILPWGNRGRGLHSRRGWGSRFTRWGCHRPCSSFGNISLLKNEEQQENQCQSISRVTAVCTDHSVSKPASQSVGLPVNWSVSSHINLKISDAKLGMNNGIIFYKDLCFCVV